ncbi:unnamed protein product [Polarella glacialis]|uniref:WW domain-containing protein n=1 Tax=Polarella glacialis TaxID=89957 RepID=A0A813KRY0_POLGL|nr:unnamed protein product [Polarella glacialis]
MSQKRRPPNAVISTSSSAKDRLAFTSRRSNSNLGRDPTQGGRAPAPSDSFSVGPCHSQLDHPSTELEELLKANDQRVLSLVSLQLEAMRADMVRQAQRQTEISGLENEELWAQPGDAVAARRCQVAGGKGGTTECSRSAQDPDLRIAGGSSLSSQAPRLPFLRDIDVGSNQVGRHEPNLPLPGEVASLHAAAAGETQNGHVSHDESGEEAARLFRRLHRMPTRSRSNVEESSSPTRSEAVQGRRTRRQSLAAPEVFSPGPDDCEVDSPKNTMVFADAATMKDQVRKAIHKPVYRVADYYYDEGICQAIARSAKFDFITLVVIAVNTLWIAVDMDNNKAESPLVAGWEFLVMDNAFCFFFSGELIIRFGAFCHKRHAVKDISFVFDSFLVGMMVLETWIQPGVLLILRAASGGSKAGSPNLGAGSILRIFRLMRLTRVARLGRLMRALPELMVLIKGLVTASRSVFFTMALLTMVVYIFAIALCQLSAGTQLGETYFTSIPHGMMSLLLYGALPDVSFIVYQFLNEGAIYGIIFLIYILLAYLTVMNMLTGVIVEVVGVVASMENEEMSVKFVRSRLLTVLRAVKGEASEETLITREEFETYLTRTDFVRAVQDVGVDALGLIDLADIIFPENYSIKFGEFMEVMLQLRGSNQATVKDIVDLRKYVIQELNDSYSDTNRVLEQLLSKVNSLSQLSDLLILGASRVDGHRPSPLSPAAAPTVDPSTSSLRPAVSKRAVVPAEDPNPEGLQSPKVSAGGATEAERVRPPARLQPLGSADISMPALPPPRIQAAARSEAPSTPGTRRSFRKRTSFRPSYAGLRRCQDRICIAIGVIMSIVTRVTAETDETSFVIDWVAEDIRSFTLPALEEKGCNYVAYVEKSKCSSTVWSYNTFGSGAVSPPRNCIVGFEADDRDPALRHIGDIPGAKVSTCVTSSNPMWVMDECKEFAEAITGVATILIISAIGGCCCGVGVILFAWPSAAVAASSLSRGRHLRRIGNSNSSLTAAHRWWASPLFKDKLYRARLCHDGPLSSSIGSRDGDRGDDGASGGAESSRLSSYEKLATEHALRELQLDVLRRQLASVWSGGAGGVGFGDPLFELEALFSKLFLQHQSTARQLQRLTPPSQPPGGPSSPAEVRQRILGRLALAAQAPVPDDFAESDLRKDPDEGKLWRYGDYREQHAGAYCRIDIRDYWRTKCIPSTASSTRQARPVTPPEPSAQEDAAETGGAGVCWEDKVVELDDGDATPCGIYELQVDKENCGFKEQNSISSFREAPAEVMLKPPVDRIVLSALDCKSSIGMQRDATHPPTVATAGHKIARISKSRRLGPADIHPPKPQLLRFAADIMHNHKSIGQIGFRSTAPFSTAAADLCDTVKLIAPGDLIIAYGGLNGLVERHALGMCSRLQRFEEVDSLIKQMDSEGIERTGVTYAKLMSSCAESQRWSEALTLLTELKSKDELDASTNWDVVYLMSMTACARAGKTDEVRTLLAEMASAGKGTVHNSHYNALIVSCGSDGAAALEVFQEMKAAGLTPRAPDWRVLLTCNRDSKEQQRIYAMMRQELPTAPLEEAWAVLLRTALNTEDFDAADWIFEEMRTSGVGPESDRAMATPSLKRALRWHGIKLAQATAKAAWQQSNATSASALSSLPGGAPAVSSALPTGWASAVDPGTGREYYWRSDSPATTTTWERPLI